MPNKKQAIIIGVLCVISLGLGYWVGLPEEGSGRGKEAAEKAADDKAAAQKAADEKAAAQKAAADKAAAKAAPNGINQTSDVKIGTPIWEFKTGGTVYSSPAIGSDGTVYVGSLDYKLYAINGKSGVKLWEFVTRGSVSSSPVIGADGTLYVGSNDNKIYAIKTDSKGLAKSPWPMRGRNAQHTGNRNDFR